MHRACLLFLLSACGTPPTRVPVAWQSFATAVDASGTAADQQKAREALRELENNPTDEAKIIWFGRRLAYLGQYQRAVEVFTFGLRIRPASPRLLRHRGHRYISLRRFDAAIADLERAAQLVAGQPDDVEPDGKPNARGIPTSTLQTNIWYHLGLAHYCRGDFAQATTCYRRCLALAKNPDMEAATRYWLFLTAKRRGDDALAQSALAGVDAGWDIIENHAYHRLLLLYRGELELSAVQQTGGADAIQNKTLAYGLARYHELRGDRARAREALAELIAEPSPAFGCIAAEADFARMPGGR